MQTRPTSVQVRIQNDPPARAWCRACCAVATPRSSTARCGSSIRSGAAAGRWFTTGCQRLLYGLGSGT